MVSVQEISKFEIKKYDSHKIAFFPSLAVVSLSQDSKITLEPLVEKDERVEEGQIIAKTAIDNYSLPSCVHSPVPGKVLGIFSVINPNGKKVPAVLIKMEGQFTFSGKKRTNLNWSHSLSTFRVRDLSEMGVVNTFEKPVSLAHQLDETINYNYKNETSTPLVIRLFDKDPETTVDHYVSQSFPKEIFEGAAIIADIIKAPEVLFISEIDTWTDYQSDESENLFRNANVRHLELKVNNYPRGNYKYIKKTALDFINSKSEKKFKEILAVDGSTCLDVYNAVVKSYPVIDRFIQVGGDDIVSPGIYKVKIGTTFRKLFEECNGFVEEPAKIVVNGLISGIAVSDLDTPVTRYVKSILVLSKRGFPDQRQTACIRCGSCYNICPEHIHPEKIYANYYSETPINRYVTDTITMCTECGLCNAVCPSRIPLYQTIQLIKDSQYEK